MALEFNVSAMTGVLNPLYDNISSQLSLGMASVAADMEHYAKRNAPWTDRTGNARRTLTGFVVSEDEDTMLIGLAGMMHYSPKLELNYGGRYAIIVPTLDSYAPRLMDAVVQSALKLGGVI